MKCPEAAELYEKEWVWIEIGGNWQVAKCLARTCPECSDYLGVVILQSERPNVEIPVIGTCIRCGYRFTWKVLPGNKPSRSLAVRAIALAVACLLAFTSLIFS